MMPAGNRESGIVKGESAGLRASRWAMVDSPHLHFIGKGSHSSQRESTSLRVFRFTIHPSRFTTSFP